jgi:hypothetical protein
VSSTVATGALTREIYEAFQRIEFDRWDAVIAADVASTVRPDTECQGCGC